MMDAASSEDMMLSKKSLKEVLVFQDEGAFTHSTGDTYVGSFEIKKKDHSIKMNGTGMYTTAAGETYIGDWDHDKLKPNEVVTIRYPDGAKYEGVFKDWCYYGAGKYTYPDGTVMLGNFIENCPVGGITLYDPNGHKWLGKADVGYAWMAPVNHYYDILDSTLELHKKVQHPSKTIEAPPPKKEKPRKVTLKA